MKPQVIAIIGDWLPLALVGCFWTSCCPSVARPDPDEQGFHRERLRSSSTPSRSDVMRGGRCSRRALLVSSARETFRRLSGPQARG